jgi:hypothetical protein
MALRPSLLFAPYRPYVPASTWRTGGDKLGRDGEFGVLAVPAGDLDAHDVKGVREAVGFFSSASPSGLMGGPMPRAKSNIRVSYQTALQIDQTVLQTAGPGSPTIDHPATSLGPRCAISTRPSAEFFQRTKNDPPWGLDSAPRFLHHQPLIQSDDMKWRFPGQRAPAILDGTAQADIVRALALCRIMR